jgi:hypothetical protein
MFYMMQAKVDRINHNEARDARACGSSGRSSGRATRRFLEASVDLFGLPSLVNPVPAPAIP